MNKEKKTSKKIVILRILFAILLIETFIIIFEFSGQNGEVSTNTSTSLMYKIIDVVNGKQEVKQNDVERFEPLLRKLAHFGIYFMVGIWSMCLMSTFFREDREKEQNMKRITISTVIGFLYACSDEIHQMFLNGRDGNLLDVIIDTMGVINGGLIVLLIIKINKK